jgi:hypothetical protein
VGDSLEKLSWHLAVTHKNNCHGSSLYRVRKKKTNQSSFVLSKSLLHTHMYTCYAQLFYWLPISLKSIKINFNGKTHFTTYSGIIVTWLEQLFGYEKKFLRFCFFHLVIQYLIIFFFLFRRHH